LVPADEAIARAVSAAVARKSAAGRLATDLRHPDARRLTERQYDGPGQ